MIRHDRIPKDYDEFGLELKFSSLFVMVHTS